VIYTIGNTEAYEQYFQEQSNPRKAITGSVWKNWRQAWWYTVISKHFPATDEYEAYTAFVNNGYSVYGVWADWERDTVNTGSPWNDLIRPADLIKIRKEWGGTL
jgi:hypothetical protein